MQSRISTIIFCLIPAAVLAPGMRAQTCDSHEPIARIGGQAIYEEDLLPSIAGQLFQLKNQEYELKSKELEKLVNQRLLVCSEEQGTLDRRLPAADGGPVSARAHAN